MGSVDRGDHSIAPTRPPLRVTRAISDSVAFGGPVWISTLSQNAASNSPSLAGMERMSPISYRALDAPNFSARMRAFDKSLGRIIAGLVT
jgi:hypothetical protein